MRVLDQLFFDRRFPREKPSKQKKAPETSVLSLQRGWNEIERRVVVREPFREFAARGRPGGGSSHMYLSSFTTLVPMLRGRAVYVVEKRAQHGKAAETSVVSLQQSRDESERRVLVRESCSQQ